LGVIWVIVVGAVLLAAMVIALFRRQARLRPVPRDQTSPHPLDSQEAWSGAVIDQHDRPRR